MLDKIKTLVKKNKFFEGIIYIAFRVAGLFTSLTCLVLRIFPIQHNKIVCCNMKGRRYGDNPKYIADEILSQNSGYEIVWLMLPEYQDGIPEGIRVAKYSYFSMLYELATAGIWIDSNTKPYGILKRKGQVFIQTWHGSYGLKKIGGDLKDSLTRIDRAYLKYSAKIEDLRISNSRFYSDIYRRAFWYEGDILECGSPRNDIFFENPPKVREKVDAYFHTGGKRLAIYAPTYREDFGVEAYRLDFNRLADNLERRFGGEWAILVRLHYYNIEEAKQFMTYDDRIMNATDYSVMQELLVACDVLISDYSSCMFDFITVPKPCFLYATDAEAYKNSRDFYFSLESLPFPLAHDNEELEQVILRFDGDQYEKDVRSLFERVGLCETGQARRKVVEWIGEHTRKI